MDRPVKSGSAGEEVQSAWFVDRLVGLVVYEKE